MRLMPTTRWLLLIVMGWSTLAGNSCSGFFDPAPDEAISKLTYYEYRRLPDGPDDLLAMARELTVENALPDEMRRSLLASCRLIEVSPQHREAHALAARACGWLQDFGEPTVCYDSRSSRTRVVDCVELAQKAVALDPDNASTRYTLAINIGQQLEHSSIAHASTLISPLIETLKRVIEMDEDIDEGGALRVLGALYLKAPPWPTGPGDLDMALELLERAVTNHPDHPLNQLFMAEALLEDESPKEALLAVERAKERLDPVKYHWRAERWRPRVDKIERRIRKAVDE
jgi:tetratricopeptide (TPR) repeat protein